MNLGRLTRGEAMTSVRPVEELSRGVARVWDLQPLCREGHVVRIRAVSLALHK